MLMEKKMANDVKSWDFDGFRGDFGVFDVQICSDMKPGGIPLASQTGLGSLNLPTEGILQGKPASVMTFLWTR